MPGRAMILVVEDEEDLRSALCETLEMSGYTTLQAESAGRALELLEDTTPALVISDVQMSGMNGHEFLLQCKSNWPEIPVVLMTAYATVDGAVEAMRKGALDYICKPFEATVLIEAVERLAVQPQPQGSLVIADSISQATAELALRVASTDASVMIHGESGVGKEVFARLIHQNSCRSDQPFVAINCAAIPENMLESILFGYEKGAFTGAYTARAGKFEQANGGTLLLDEISEMELSLQAKLLRVLQECEVERLGGKQAIPLDVRILATTNRELQQEVATGRFRQDLFYRLNVFPLKVPSLRERPRDIIPLCKNFIAELAPGQGISLDGFAEKLLVNYPWPGNVRELQNVMQRAVILKSGSVVGEGAIMFESGGESCERVGLVEESPVPGVANDTPTPILSDNLKSTELDLIIKTLCAENGSRKDTAARLGISPRTLRYKLAKFKQQGIAIPYISNAGIA